MRYLIFLGIMIFLQSCGSNQFTKRKYTKGIYIAKHSHGKSKPLKKKSAQVKRKANVSYPIEVVTSENEVYVENNLEYVRKGRTDDSYLESNSYEEIEEVRVQNAPPVVSTFQDGEELTKEDRSRKPLIFGILAAAFFVLGIGTGSIAYFLGVAGLVSFSISIGFASAVMASLGTIFSVIEHRRGGNSLAKIGLILGISTLVLIAVTLIVGLFVFSVI